MLTLGELQKNPKLLDKLGGRHVLVAATDETVVAKEAKAPEATMVFEHETIKMMMAERAERLEKLKAMLTPESAVIPLAKKAGSFWDHITLGRASTADIVLDDLAISNVHAHFEIDEEEGRTTVQDVGSSNGTHVNRQPLQAHTPTPLRSGDVVRFGQTIFYYVTHGTLEQLVRGG